MSPAAAADGTRVPSKFLNYTTMIGVDQTIGEIHGILRRHRTRSVTDEFDPHGQVIAVHFLFGTEWGEREFRLPANIEGVQARLVEVAADLPPGWRGGRDKLQGRAQAERVAWRIIKDWLEAQLAIIESKQVKFEQVMLPYLIAARDGDDRPITVYEVFRAEQMKMLTDGGRGSNRAR